MGMDRAVGYAVLSRIWQLATGPVTQLLIIFFFSEVTQGYYYAFSYLLGMQIFVELGLHVVIISVSSHEWSRLSLVNGQVRGDSQALSRLASLNRLTFRWYSVVSVLFVVGVTAAGMFYFFDTSRLKLAVDGTTSQVPWVAPWLALVLLTGLQLPLLPMTAVLEGCHQLPTINSVRFRQAVAGTAVVWLLITTGAGLWALAGSAFVRLAAEAYLVLVRYRPFFRSIRRSEESVVLDWRSEILPLQWRIAVQGTLLWFVNGLPGLVIFRWHGESAAGRLGMTWTILTALQSASMAWIETRRPQFGTLIADSRFNELDRLFFRLTRLAVGLMTSAAVLFTSAVWWIGTRQEWLFERLSGRMLPVESTALFALALVVLQISLCTNLYVRAHKRDPFLVAAVISSCTIAGLEFWLGRAQGVQGVAVGYLIGVSCVQFPLWTLIWWHSRRSWHAAAVPADTAPADRREAPDA